VPDFTEFAVPCLSFMVYRELATGNQVVLAEVRQPPLNPIEIHRLSL
jgi:hypothetical protein